MRKYNQIVILETSDTPTGIHTELLHGSKIPDGYIYPFNKRIQLD